MSKKIAPGILRFASMLFLIFEKGISKKIVTGILRFVSILVLIFEKGHFSYSGYLIFSYFTVVFKKSAIISSQEL